MERTTLSGGSRRFRSQHFALPAFPAPTCFVGLSALQAPSAAGRPPQRLFAATASGRLLRLAQGGSRVDTEADVQARDRGRVMCAHGGGSDAPCLPAASSYLTA